MGKTKKKKRSRKIYGSDVIGPIWRTSHFSDLALKEYKNDPKMLIWILSQIKKYSKDAIAKFEKFEEQQWKKYED